MFGDDLVGVSLWSPNAFWEDKGGEGAFVSELPYLGWRSGWMKTFVRTDEGEDVFYARPESDAVSVVLHLRTERSW